jgi:mannitol/fructose-specific phosphotransferase system IIA component (Ntr-type)
MAEPQYIQAMIDAVHEYGPYIVLIPGVAMPHARGESGVIKNGMSLITLREPVDFLDSDNNPVSLVVCLAAASNDAHLEAIQDLARFLDSGENISAVRDADEIEQVVELIKKY